MTRLIVGRKIALDHDLPGSLKLNSIPAFIEFKYAGAKGMFFVRGVYLQNDKFIMYMTRSDKDDLRLAVSNGNTCPKQILELLTSINYPDDLDFNKNNITLNEFKARLLMIEELIKE